MIFVTVGTHEQQFNRLVEEIDKLIEKGKLLEKVIIQTGYSDYKPRHAAWFKFKNKQEIEKIMRRANIIIAHGGSGTLLTASSLGKPVIGVPRLKKFNEHTNDHQIQIVKELEKEKRIIAVYDIKNLYNAIQKAKKMNIKSRKQEIVMIPTINEFLGKLK